MSARVDQCLMLWSALNLNMSGRRKRSALNVSAGGAVCGREGVRAGWDGMLWSSNDHNGTARGGVRYGRDGVRAGGRDGVRAGRCAGGAVCGRDGVRAGRDGMLWSSSDHNGTARGGVRYGRDGLRKTHQTQEVTTRRDAVSQDKRIQYTKQDTTRQPHTRQDNSICYIARHIRHERSRQDGLLQGKTRQYNTSTLQ